MDEAITLRRLDIRPGPRAVLGYFSWYWPLIFLAAVVVVKLAGGGVGWVVVATFVLTVALVPVLRWRVFLSAGPDGVIIGRLWLRRRNFKWSDIAIVGPEWAGPDLLGRKAAAVSFCRRGKLLPVIAYATLAGRRGRAIDPPPELYELCRRIAGLDPAQLTLGAPDEWVAASDWDPKQNDGPAK